MSRQLSQHAADKLKEWEGLRLTAYRDQGGVLTIGYGHTGVNVTESLTITQVQADALFEADTAWARAAVERRVTDPLNDNQFGALVSFTFNLGVSALQESTVLRVANGSGEMSMRSALMMWINVKHRPNDGLRNRRAHEADLWEETAYGST